jgi:lipid-binding SYLF domain-containing protein
MHRRSLAPAAFLAALGAAATPRPAGAQLASSRAEIDAAVAEAAERLRATPNTAALFGAAHAVLVFPRIVSAGFLVGGQFGEGALLQAGRTEGHFRIVGGSFGFQIGVQRAGLAMFFMTEDALRALLAADGWEIGTGPSVTLLDAGAQVNITATTVREPVYAVSFNQGGLMASLAIQGTKITRIQPG